MKDSNIQDVPVIYPQLLEKSEEIGFTMPSDLYIGTLLKTLIASKPAARFLELGTGIGLSLAWMIDGMDSASTIISIDNEPLLSQIAKDYFGTDKRVKIVCEDGTIWLKEYKGAKFDLIFADAWPGKYSEIEIVLDLVSRGGFYVIDDMDQQPNWPLGHAEKASQLIQYLENRDDFTISKMNWSTGIIIAVKK